MSFVSYLLKETHVHCLIRAKKTSVGSRMYKKLGVVGKVHVKPYYRESGQLETETNHFCRTH